MLWRTNHSVQTFLSLIYKEIIEGKHLETSIQFDTVTICLLNLMIKKKGYCVFKFSFHFSGNSFFFLIICHQVHFLVIHYYCVYKNMGYGSWEINKKPDLS